MDWCGLFLCANHSPFGASRRVDKWRLHVQSGRETSAVNHGETCRWLYRVETHYGVSGDGSGLGPGTMGRGMGRAWTVAGGWLVWVCGSTTSWWFGWSSINRNCGLHFCLWGAIMSACILPIATFVWHRINQKKPVVCYKWIRRYTASMTIRSQNNRKLSARRLPGWKSKLKPTWSAPTGDPPTRVKSNGLCTTWEADLLLEGGKNPRNGCRQNSAVLFFISFCDTVRATTRPRGSQSHGLMSWFIHRRRRWGAHVGEISGANGENVDFKKINLDV
jgi:hypothetical protein